MADLKPCPFCGCTEIDEYEGDWGNGVYCMECGAMMGEQVHLDYRADRVTYEEAAEAWNTRAERTCKMFRVSNTQDIRECSVCGAHIDFARPLDRRFFIYCPNCKSKITH